MKISLVTLIIIILLLGLYSCSKETAIPVKADFSFEVLDHDYSVPVHITFTNKSNGGETFKWTFEGGDPNTFDEADPGEVIYTIPGSYKVLLEVSNRDGSKDSKAINIKIDSVIGVQYQVSFVQDSFPAASVQIVNTTDGPDTYAWIFQGGNPTSSSNKNPGNIVFADPGPHLISLTVSNGRETYKKDTAITVAPHLQALFSYDADINNEGWEAPVTLHMRNQSITATQYNWLYTGASNGTNSQTVNPDITYTQPGTFTIQLTASNGKESMQAQKQVTILPNSNLRILTDVKFGINTAQNTLGCYFSTKKRMVYPKDSINTLGGLIDIAFYGLNSNFTYNKFIAADQTMNVGLYAINGASHTQIINSQELCGCGISFTESMFDNMQNDAVLQALNFTENAAGLQSFNAAMVPRIVLFKTASGIKGAIKIKQFVNNGTQSYILVDMKYLKQP